MSILSKLTNSIGSIFGSPTLGDSISDELLGLGGEGSLWPSIIEAGAGLAGTYFGSQQNKQNSEAYAAQQALQNELEQKKLDQVKEIEMAQIAGANERARIAAAASAGAARKSSLASLYNNWANLVARGGEAQASTALGTGKGITDAINTRAAVLK